MEQTRSVLRLMHCFRYDAKSGHSFCRIRSSDLICRQKISKNHHGNKMRHLKKFHANIHSQLISNKKKKKVRNLFVKSIKVKMNIQTIYAAFVELVSKNGRPFCISEDSGMRLIIDPLLEGVFNETGEKYAVNRVIIEEKVHEAYLIMLDRLKGEIKNTPVTVMIDIATKHNRSILGVNIRFFKNGKFVIRTLCMRELLKIHTASNIHELLKDTLATFEISAIQIYAYVSDNAGNVTNVSKLLNIDCENFVAAEGLDLEDEMFSLINDQFFGSIMTDVENIVSNENTSYVNFVPCAAHTTQLAVNDATKVPVLKSNIDFVKEIVKQLRTPTLSRILRERQLKQAIIDHDIRWSYKYLMVS